MKKPNNKQQAIDDLMAIETEIQKLAQEGSLATLEHTLNAQIEQTDLILLKEIQLKSQKMLQTMQESKQEKTKEIIKYKNTGKRIRLYSDIAQQK